nr:MAG TPA: hypothetical protein [Bacteriophage sp.]
MEINIFLFNNRYIVENKEVDDNMVIHFFIFIKKGCDEYV